MWQASGVRALVLAAGWATRLGPIAQDRPKHLLPVGATTPLDVVVDRLDALPQVERICVWTNDAFAQAFEAWAHERTCRASLAVASNGTRRLEERLGAVGDLARYLERDPCDEPLLILGGDQLFDAGLDEVARVAVHHAVVAVHDVGRPDLVRRYASVEIDADGRVLRLVEKDPAPNGTLAVTAIYGLPAEVLPEVSRHLAEGGAPDNLGHLAERLAGQGRLRGVRLEGRWIDVGSADEYARGRRAFAQAEAPR